MAPQHGEPLVLTTLENLVQLAKAQLCDALEKLYGGDFARWLCVLKRIEAEGVVKPGPYLDALHELTANLESLLRQKGRVSDE